jgi:hypothetical protein
MHSNESWVGSAELPHNHLASTVKEGNKLRASIRSVFLFLIISDYNNFSSIMHEKVKSNGVSYPRI